MIQLGGFYFQICRALFTDRLDVIESFGESVMK
jgi:hypothetical protein